MRSWCDLHAHTCKGRCRHVQCVYLEEWMCICECVHADPMLTLCGPCAYRVCWSYAPYADPMRTLYLPCVLALC